MPTDVGGVGWASKNVIVWKYWPCADYYNIYKQTTASLSDADGDGLADSYGSCDQMGLSRNMAPDSMVPPTGYSSFYLITGESEAVGEGTLGYASNGHERPWTGTERCP